MRRIIRGGRADDAGAELKMTPFRRPTAAPEPAVPDEDAGIGISGDPSAQPVGPVRRWQSFGGGGRSAAAAAQWQEPTPAAAQDLAVVDLVRPPPTRYVIPPAPTPMAAPAPSTVVPAVAPVAVRVPRTLPRGFASRNAAAVAGWAADPSVVGVRPVVFSAGGGVGVSTVVAAVGGFLASVSVSPVLAVESTRRPWSSLTRFVTGDTRGMSVAAWQELRSSGHDLDSALSMAPSGASGLRVLHQDSAGFKQDWLTGQLPAAASVIIDGGSLDNPDLAGLLSTWPVAVLVVRADPAGVDAALVTVGHLRASLPAGGLDVLMVLSDCAAFGGATVRAAAKLAGSVGEVLTLPNSAGLREQPIRIDRLDKSVAAVIADIAHSVVDRSWRRGNPQPAVPATASSAGDDVGGSTPAVPAVTYQKET